MHFLSTTFSPSLVQFSCNNDYQLLLLLSYYFTVTWPSTALHFSFPSLKSNHSHVFHGWCQRRTTQVCSWMSSTTLYEVCWRGWQWCRSLRCPCCSALWWHPQHYLGLDPPRIHLHNKMIRRNVKINQRYYLQAMLVHSSETSCPQYISRFIIWESTGEMKWKNKSWDKTIIK